MKKLWKRFEKSILGRSIFRTGFPESDRERSESMISSFLLHIQPAKVNKHSLKWTTTLGLGLLSFYLFIILFVTGVLLMFYYIPSVKEAYNSIKDLEYVVSFGQLLRNMHRWAAHLMVITVFLHLCRVFYTGAYKSPREFNWVLGVSLLVMTLFLSFTGYLLPWDQLAYWAITVGTNIAGYAPLIGGKMRFLLLGGHTVGQAALLRFYVFHVIFLPMVMTFVICIHIWRVRKDGGLARPIALQSQDQEVKEISPAKTYGLMMVVKGTSPQVGQEPDDEVFSWPHLIFREITLFIAASLILLTLSMIYNAPLEELANLVHPPNPAKAPWYFLGLQELVSYSALIGGVIVPGILVLSLLFLPYFDRSQKGVGVWFSSERIFAITVFTILVLCTISLVLIGTFFRGPNWQWQWPWIIPGS